MTHTTYRLKAQVPVLVGVDERRIYCNSTKGYNLYARNVTSGERRLLETHIGATIKDNPYTLGSDEEFMIEAI